MDRKRLLIIEDDRDMCNELAELLRDESFEVDTSGDGHEGRRLIEDNAYDLVLLDLKLPTGDGIELLRMIKAADRTRVIVMTGRPVRSELSEQLPPDADEDRDALGLADHLVEKPFRIEHLVSSIRKLCG